MNGIRNQYERQGVEGFYQTCGNQYQNPHEHIIRTLLNCHYQESPTCRVLDLCCGSGEVTRALSHCCASIQGLDPFTYQLYEKSTGNTCYVMDFKAIACEALPVSFDVIICSFALHLCEENLLPQVLYQLAIHCKKLIILTPHKRPEIPLFFTLTKEVMEKRVRYREYDSQLYVAISMQETERKSEVDSA